MVKPSPAHWWQDQVDIVTWGALSNEKDARWIDFARATGAEIMDRAFLFQAWKHGPAPDTAHEQCRQAAEFFHSRGFKFTSFIPPRTRKAPTAGTPPLPLSTAFWRNSKNMSTTAATASTWTYLTR
jgi:hypothetical protein